jgi:transcriptional regulator with XRE-family HTH domain
MLAFVPIREEIQRARKAAKLTQNELAEACNKLGGNIRQKDISEYESGKQNPSLEKIEVIAKALGKKWTLS